MISSKRSNENRVMFKNLRFNHKRNNIQESHENTEIVLLNNYLKIILDILENESIESVKESFHNMDLDAFLSSLKIAGQEFKRAIEGKNSRRITFESLKSNLILNDEDLNSSDVLNLVEEYEQIFGSQ